MLASALLTGFTVFFIEQRKIRRVFEEKQQGVVELLRHDVRLTMNGFDRYVVDMTKRLTKKNYQDANQIISAIQLILESTKSELLPAIYNNFQYLPPILQERSTDFYRRISELETMVKKVSAISDAAFCVPEVFDKVALFVYRSMADGSKLAAEIHRFCGRYREALYEDKSTAQYKQLQDLIKEGSLKDSVQKELSESADDGRIHNG